MLAFEGHNQPPGGIVCSIAVLEGAGIVEFLLLLVYITGLLMLVIVRGDYARSLPKNTTSLF